jgi:hypothetical protein
MSDQTIKCPSCGKEILLTEALTGQIEQSIRAKYEAEAAKKEQDINAREKKLKQQEKSLAEKQLAIEEQVAEQVKAERVRIAEAERKKILVEQNEQNKAIQEELEEKRKQLSDAKKQELELRKQQQKLVEEKEALELTVQRKLDEERHKIAEKAKQQASDEMLLKIKEKEQLIESLKKQAQDWQRRAEQGSQEAQGEALEGAIQDMLTQAFPYDCLEDIKKGQKGADILQVVINPNSKECGKILWEAKYAKNYTNSWIDKLKSDQQEAGADIAVLVTMALPKGVKNFDLLNGVWVTDFASVLGLAKALRMWLIGAARERMVSAKQDTAKDAIYRYVTGQEFALQIRAIAEAFGRMKGNLDQERRTMEKIWKSREKQIETVLTNVVGIQGSLQGYLSSKSLPRTDLQELLELGDSMEEEL